MTRKGENGGRRRIEGGRRDTRNVLILPKNIEAVACLSKIRLPRAGVKLGQLNISTRGTATIGYVRIPSAYTDGDGIASVLKHFKIRTIVISVSFSFKFLFFGYNATKSTVFATRSASLPSSNASVGEH